MNRVQQPRTLLERPQQHLPGSLTSTDQRQSLQLEVNNFLQQKMLQQQHATEKAVVVGHPVDNPGANGWFL